MTEPTERDELGELDDLEDDEFEDEFEDDEDDAADEAADSEAEPVRAGRRSHLVRAGRSGGTRLTRWRRRASGALVLGVALSALGVGYAALAPGSNADNGSAEVRAGQDLYQNACIACHGRNLQGIPGRAPSLLGAGQADVYFQVATGRMPLARQEAQAAEKPPKLTEEQAQQLAAYVQFIGGGPKLPDLPPGSTLHDGNVAEGGELFRLNCAQCHNFAAKGGALSSGKEAPGLGNATDAIIYAAMLSGPENMPVFGDNQLTPDQKRSVIAYVQTLKQIKDPGGHGLGRLGPVPEGIVIWVAGVGVLVFMAMWIGAKS